MKPYPNKLNNLQVKELARLWAAGGTLTELAARFGVTPSSIWHQTRKLPLPSSQRGPGRPARINLKVAGRMLSDGRSRLEIAERFGVTRRAVSYAVKRLEKLA